MDVPASKTARPKSGVAKFAEPQRTPPKAEARRERGKRDIVGITIRLTHEQWRIINEKAFKEGTSMAKLLLRAFSQVEQAKGMPGLPPGGALAE
jgi:hypothetical protein